MNWNSRILLMKSICMNRCWCWLFFLLPNHFRPSESEFSLGIANGKVPLTVLQLHFVFMPTWRRCVRDNPYKNTQELCLCTLMRETERKGRDRDGVGERVGLSFVLSECLLQRSKRLSRCSPTRPLSLLGHVACIKMGGLHFCLSVHNRQTFNSTSPSKVYLFIFFDSFSSSLI